MRRFPRIVTAAALALCLGGLAVALGTTARAGLAAATFSNWSAYLSGPRHSSVNGSATAITPAKVPGLTRIWRWMPAAPTMTGQPGRSLFASPTVVDGRVYIGANTGVFYALDEATGHVLWQRFLGFVTQKTCSARGFTSTATVAPDPVSGALTVYVAAADGYLYALNAGTGTTRWRSVVGIPSTTVNDYYNWSSPTVANGRIYVGVSSQCDAPLVNGGLKEYNQATGALLAFYRTYPAGSRGPSIWSSAATSPGGTAVFVTTGNGPSGSDAVSMVRLDAATLAKQALWQVPTSEHGSDSDFGGSPTLFTATLGGTAVPMVGACNKNGTYYALRQNNVAAGPVWRFKAGAPDTAGGQCDAAAIADGARLFVAGNTTTIGGVSYGGSIRLLNPATGGIRWQRGLPGPVIGSPSLDGGGVLAVPTYSSNGVFIVQASNGAMLRNIATGPEFGQPVFADNLLLLPTQKNGLWAYRPAS
jgi:polyvinyl alcohol dehydrogenase (cytochrome)